MVVYVVCGDRNREILAGTVGSISKANALFEEMILSYSIVTHSLPSNSDQQLVMTAIRDRDEPRVPDGVTHRDLFEDRNWKFRQNLVISTRPMGKLQAVLS